MKTEFLFRISPYIAAVLFAAGVALRYVTRERAGVDAARDFHADGGSGRGLLQLSLGLLLIGHLAGLAFPRWILLWNGAQLRLYALEAVGFAIGLLALAGWGLTMWQHLRQPDGPVIRQAADAVFLSLLFTTLLSGSLVAVLYRWGSSWGVLTLTPYTLSLLRGQPALALVAGMPFLVRLHVFSAFVTLAVLPATRIGPLLVAALSRSLQLVSRPARGLADAARRVFGTAARRLNPAAWIWPEED